jgi:hypothetical protein
LQNPKAAYMVAVLFLFLGVIRTANSMELIHKTQ